MGLWENITIDVASDGVFVRAKAAIHIYDGNFYAKLVSVDGNLGEGMSALKAWMQKPWVKINIPDSAAEQKTFAAGFATVMNESGMAVSEDDVRSLLDTLADALFTQESTRYQNGIAYSLRLAPDHLHRAILILQSSVIGRGLKLNMDSVDFSEQQPVNLHIRVNTNTNGELVFLKWYVATEAEEISLVTQGKSQWQDHPVHVEIPKDTMGFEEFFQDVGMGDRRLDQWMMPLMDTNLWKSPIKEEDWSNASEEVVHPYRAVTPRLRQMEAPRLREGCTATPGTAYYLQLARKGVCELPSRSTYRVNDTTP